MSSDKIKNELKSAGDQGYSAVKDKAEEVQKQAKDLAETTVGGAVGKVKGGVESLTSKFDGVKDAITNTNISGMLSGETSALDNMKNAIASATLISALSAKTDNTVKITFGTAANQISLPTVVGVEPDDGEKNLEEILDIITGMGDQDPADLKKFLIKGSVSGLQNAADKISGTIGAAGGAFDIKKSAQSFIDNSISKLTEQKNNSQNYVSALQLEGLQRSITVTSGTNNKDSDYDAQINNLVKQSNDLSTIFDSSYEATFNQEGFDKDAQELSDFKSSEQLRNSLQNATPNGTELTARAEEHRRIISKKLANNSPRGVLEGLNITVASKIINDIKQIAPTISDDNLNLAIDLSQGDVADFSEAVRVVSKYSTETYDIISSTLKKVDSSITTASQPSISEVVFSEPYVVGQEKKDFSYISSVEELEAEFKAMQREVTEIVVHWTETYTNKNIGAEEIDNYHKQLGLEGIGYHLVIRRDGSIQRGKPFGQEGAHTSSRNKYTLGVVFVGGLNCPSGTPNPENFLSSRSLTRSQLNSFDYICSAFYKKVANGQIVGHTDIDPDEKDPGFDVISYVEAKFLKGSVYNDPSKEGPYSISELNKKRNLR